MSQGQRQNIGIIVLGPYRSGTSVTSNVLSRLGVNFGPKFALLPPEKENPGGFFERADINFANNALIESAGHTLADPGQPIDIAERGDLDTLQRAHLEWITTAPLWAIKDPRMCATLLAWIKAGIIDEQSLRLVHVHRRLDDVVRSAMNFAVVRQYCDGTEQGVRAMTQRYVDLADWHVQHLGVPTCDLSFESLIAEPAETVARLAQFVGVDDERAIRNAASVIGRGKGRFSVELRKFLFRATRKLLRTFAPDRVK